MAKYKFKLEIVPPDISAGAAGSWFRVSGPYLAGSVYVRLGRTSNKQYVCTGLILDNDEGKVTTSSLRDIPITQIVNELVQEYAEYAHIDVVLGAMIKRVGEAEDRGEHVETMSIPGTPTTQTERPKRGGTGPGKTGLDEFAIAYRQALNTDSQRPMAATAEMLDISVATAHRWRARCQETGRLDPQDGRSK